MQIHNLKRNTGLSRSSKVGRGGRRGKTSGRGHKGQKSRSGAGMRPNVRDDIKRVPKRRGHGKNRAKTVNSSRIAPTTINLTVLDKAIADGLKIISPKSLVKAGIIKKVKGQTPVVKILGSGGIKRKAQIKSVLVSAVARGKIDKAGGAIG